MVVLATIALLLLGCASTTIFEHGLPVLKTQADMTNVTFQTQGTFFHADTVDHSGPTLAGGQAITQVVGGVTSAIAVTGTAVAASGILSRAPVAAVAIPAGVAALTHVSNSQTANERAALNTPPELRAKMLKRKVP